MDGPHLFQDGMPSVSALGTQHTAIKIGEFESPEELKRTNSLLPSIGVLAYKNELQFSLFLLAGETATVLM